jgi:hypothetical protein
MQCPYENCKHEWDPRVKDPKVCPKCKRYLDKPQKKAKGVIDLGQTGENAAAGEGSDGQVAADN